MKRVTAVGYFKCTLITLYIEHRFHILGLFLQSLITYLISEKLFDYDSFEYCRKLMSDLKKDVKYIELRDTS